MDHSDPPPISGDPRELQLAELIATSPHNLVSRGDRAQLASAHIPEARALVPHLGCEPGQRWLDLGTGGGLPGLVLAIARADVEWVLLDATRKKVAAVEGFASALHLGNVRTLAGRAEELAHQPELRGTFHGVVARAVAPLPTLLELARGFLGAGGRLAAVKGPAWAEELEAARPAMARLGYAEPEAIHLASAVRATWLVRMRADGPPPRGYPRRVGIPRQDPIGGR